MSNRLEDETKARSFGWKHYKFKFRTTSGKTRVVDVYASDDETAAILFDRVYAHDCKEVL